MRRYILDELEAIENVKMELANAKNKHDAYEILGRLVNLYSALNIAEIKAIVIESEFSENKAA